jgi:hypothetical protein
MMHFMRILFLNGMISFFVAGTPLLILEIGRACSDWIEEHHHGLGLLMGFLILAAIRYWVWPRFGLQPN